LGTAHPIENRSSREVARKTFQIYGAIGSFHLSRWPNATINSLPLEVDFMVIGWLPIKGALNMAKALLIPEQVAVQFFACDRKDLRHYFNYNIYDLKPSSFKFLLKNKKFQIKAYSFDKTLAAVRTKDLDFAKKYLEQVKPDLNEALVEAAIFGFTDAVKLLLSDYRVNPSGYVKWALVFASQEGHLEIVKCLLLDDRVDPSAENNEGLSCAAQNGHLEIVKLLLKDDRVDPSVLDNRALISAALVAHLEILEKVLPPYFNI
jgi:ankyrin repeat protein